MTRQNKIDTNDPKIREKFLEAWIEFEDAFDAVLEAFPKVETNEAYRAAQTFEKIDSLRKERKQRLAELDEDETILPSQQEFSYEIWKQMKACKDPAVAEKLARLFAQTQGYLRKLSDGTGSDAGNVQKMMVVPTTGSEEEWERELKKQQKRLEQYKLEEEKEKRKV